MSVRVRPAPKSAVVFEKLPATTTPEASQATVDAAVSPPVTVFAHAKSPAGVSFQTKA